MSYSLNSSKGGSFGGTRRLDNGPCRVVGLG